MTDETKHFLEEIGEVCRKHGYSIGHEDGHGAFIVRPFDEGYLEWLGHAIVKLDSDEEPQPVCTCTLRNVDYPNDCPVHDGRAEAERTQTGAEDHADLIAEREMLQAQTPVVNVQEEAE